MASNGHGGYRRPENPAMVSGPGALSKRTDGGPGQPVTPLTGLGYGENQALNAMQGAAPMADATEGAAPRITPLSAPSARPQEPITHGAPFGPGPGPTTQSAGRLTQVLQSLLGDDIVGGLEELYLAAEAQGL